MENAALTSPESLNMVNMKALPKKTKNLPQRLHTVQPKYIKIQEKTHGTNKDTRQQNRRWHVEEKVLGNSGKELTNVLARDAIVALTLQVITEMIEYKR